MPWSSQGGGGGGPWGAGGGQGPRGGGPGGPQPPNLEELLRRGQAGLKRVLPSGAGTGWMVGLIVAAIVALWAATGFYRVALDEQGVTLRFGAWIKPVTPSGLHYWWPWPVGEVFKPKVTRVHRVEVGSRSVSDSPRRGGSARDVTEESMILTGDENIVDMDFIVLWRIRDAGDYLFNIRDPEGTVKIAAESAMREVVGQSTFDHAVTIGRQDIEQRTRELLQQILDSYGAGIGIQNVQLQKVDPPSEVIDAFNDVQRARQDKERLRNEAEAYANAVVPQARGLAEQKIQAASAYKEKAIKESEGEAAQFLKIYDSYLVAPEVTQRRIYLETLGEVLANSNKIIIDSAAQGRGPGVVPYLPLPEIQKRARRKAAEGTTR